MTEVAGKERPGKGVVFSVKELLSVLGTFGFEESHDGKTTEFVNLDHKAIRIMNRLSEYMQVNGMAQVEDYIGR